MFIHGGTGLYGKVDQVPGLFYVATRFFHLYYIPLIPLKSFVIRVGSEKEDDFDGSALGLNFKSIAFAWLRLGLLAGCAAAWIGIVTSGLEVIAGVIAAWPRLVMAVVLSGLLLILLYASYGFTRAKPLRALELARQIGVSPEEVAEYFVDCDSLPGLEESLSSEPVMDDQMQITRDQ